MPMKARQVRGVNPGCENRAVSSAMAGYAEGVRVSMGKRLRGPVRPA